MKRSSSTRASLLAALGKKKHDEKTKNITSVPAGARSLEKNDSLLPPESPVVKFNSEMENSYKKFSEICDTQTDLNNNLVSTPRKDTTLSPAKKVVIRSINALSMISQYDSEDSQSSQISNSSHRRELFCLTPSKTHVTPQCNIVSVSSKSQKIPDPPDFNLSDSDTESLGVAELSSLSIDDDDDHKATVVRRPHNLNPAVLISEKNLTAEKYLDTTVISAPPAVDINGPLLDPASKEAIIDHLAVEEKQNTVEERRPQAEGLQGAGLLSEDLANLSIDELEVTPVTMDDGIFVGSPSNKPELEHELSAEKPQGCDSMTNDFLLEAAEASILSFDDVVGKAYNIIAEAVDNQNKSNTSVSQVFSSSVQPQPDQQANSVASVPIITFADGFDENVCADVLASVNLDLHSGEAIVLPLTPLEAAESEDISVTATPATDINSESAVESVPNAALALHPEGNEENQNTVEVVAEGGEAEEEHPKPRSSQPERWKRNIVKQMNDSGLAHVSLKGKQREARSISEGCTNKCKRNCHHNFSADRRKQIFSEFWAQKSHTLQWCYIASHVKSDSVQKRTIITIPGEDPRRKFSNSYFLPLENGLDRQVCQKFFLGTLGITEKWIRTALEKQRTNNGTVPQDKRGKKKKPSVVSTVIKQDIISHIKKFKTVEGHYTRKNSKAKYLPETLNRRKMYAMYAIEKQAEGGSGKIATLRQYRDVFRKEFNLKFYRPKKDQCARCLSWKNRTPRERTQEAKEKYEKHISDKKAAEAAKTQDIEEIKSSPELQEKVCLFSCDLEKTLECPKGLNGEFYYKSKLTVYNFTIFVSGEQKGYCFVWDQTEAHRGSAEITSCLWYFLQKKVETGITEFRIYSDNCSAQNKNQFLFSMYVMASIRFGIKITHRYLEVGHTHMEVDSIHACIENSVKNTDIFVPSQWYTAMRLAKKTRPPYHVKEITQEEIFDFKPLATHQCWDKIRTSLIKEICVNGAEPGVVKYKQEYAEDYRVMSVIKKSVGRPVNWKTIPLQRKYTGKIPVKPHELRDLQSLCHSGAIPSTYAKYYLETLPSLSTLGTEPPPPDAVSEPEDGNEDDDDVQDDQEKDSEEDSAGEENGSIGTTSDSDPEYTP